MSVAYDARNRVVSRTVKGVMTSYAYDGWNLIEDYDASGNELARYFHGPQSDDILAKISPTGAVYYIQDGNQNVTTITDGTGAVVERYSYDVYGTATITDGAGNALTVSGQGNRFMFTGRETSDWREEVGLCSSTAREGERRGHARVQFIAEIGIYDYRNRVYSATLGRFLQTDPIRFAAGDINIYRYVGNGPVNGTDPLGEDYTLLNDSNGFMGHGHSASLVDNPQGGVDYYSKNGTGKGNDFLGISVSSGEMACELGKCPCKIAFI